ncbi:hypothetical protein A0J61_02870 [Choanephora cucurbitarum]|uniref:Uncharacterized protein n=1 Tax=Choanephora cucurbitarum TaxID=101091 RepID=A0A1C7NJB7_9FUNG|nr:hypothetical protein A0J61_02870 [Choanephora cucurbitarum]
MCGNLLYSSTNVQNSLGPRLFRWCEKKFKEEQEDEVESESILSEVFRLEEKGDKDLTEQLQIMSCKLIMAFNTLTSLQKNALKLSVSNITNFNCTQYSDKYARYLNLAQYKKLTELKAPKIISQEEEEEVKRYFEDAKQAVFEKGEGVQISVSEGAKQQIAYICVMMKNKYTEWQPFLSSDSEEDDESSVASKRKRKRKAGLDKSSIVQVVKELLNAVFGDTLLRWRSGEQITEATKRMGKQNECAATPTTTAIRNLMGRRSDLVAYNEKKVPVCISEVKDGKSSYSSMTQESKNIRCTKSPQVYNALAGGSDSTSGYMYYLKEFEGIDVVLPGKRLKLPIRVKETDELEVTLVAIYELKAFIKEYSSQLLDQLTAAEKATQVYHSPK